MNLRDLFCLHLWKCQGNHYRQSGGGRENPTESRSLPLKRPVKVYQTVALRTFVLKLPGSSQELMTDLKRKKARWQGFIFFCKAAELSEMRKDATDTKRRVSTCSSLRRHRSTQPPHRGTWQDSEHLPRVASSGSISVKKQCNLFRTV